MFVRYSYYIRRAPSQERRMGLGSARFDKIVTRNTNYSMKPDFGVLGEGIARLA